MDNRTPSNNHRPGASSWRAPGAASDKSFPPAGKTRGFSPRPEPCCTTTSGARFVAWVRLTAICFGLSLRYCRHSPLLRRDIKRNLRAALVDAASQRRSQDRGVANRKRWKHLSRIPKGWQTRFGQCSGSLEEGRLIYENNTSGAYPLARKPFQVHVALRQLRRIGCRGARQGAGRRAARTRTEADAKRLAPDGSTCEVVSATSLKVGDIVAVEAGEIIPSDGEVIEGIASVNEAAIAPPSPAARRFCPIRSRCASPPPVPPSSTA